MVKHTHKLKKLYHRLTLLKGGQAFTPLVNKAYCEGCDKILTVEVKAK